MTMYEELTRKVEILKAAALKCYRRGMLDMALVWSQKAHQLHASIMDMSVQAAEIDYHI